MISQKWWFFKKSIRTNFVDIFFDKTLFQKNPNFELWLWIIFVADMGSIRTFGVLFLIMDQRSVPKFSSENFCNFKYLFWLLFLHLICIFAMNNFKKKTRYKLWIFRPCISSGLGAFCLFAVHLCTGGPVFLNKGRNFLSYRKGFSLWIFFKRFFPTINSPFSLRSSLIVLFLY